MKLPKSFYKLKAWEQEVHLIKMLEEVHEREKQIREMLGKIRGGYKFEVSEIDRPDLITLKE